MAEITRHQLSALLLSALQDRGLGARDLFEGRQEPLSWFFRAVAYDQSELDILESGALDALHAPSAMVELVIDEMALGLANIGTEGLGTYLASPASDVPGHEGPELDPEVMLGYVHIDVAPPALWLDERESDPSRNDALATRLSRVAQDVGTVSDTVEVHIEGALDPGGGWTDPGESVRPAGVAVHFTFDIPLVGTGKRELAAVFARAAEGARDAVEGMRSVFRGDHE
ncbi:hypothetical protein [Candidatus Palauibacter sp.]|uniref:hypothetical protein n=1 Tax=Candidatus Palauibacter sp. TaxID=3101350 RepID=UPI003B5262B0